MAGWGSSGRTGGEGRRVSPGPRCGKAPRPFPAAELPVVASSGPALVGRVLVDSASVGVAPLVRASAALAPGAMALRCLATVAGVALETAPVARATERLVSTFWLATASTVAVATTAPTPVALASRALLRVTALWAFAEAQDSWPSEDPAPDTAGPEVAESALTARTAAGRDAGTVRSG